MEEFWVDQTSPTCDATILAIRADPRVSEFVHVIVGEPHEIFEPVGVDPSPVEAVAVEPSPLEVFEAWSKDMLFAFPDIHEICFSSVGAHLIIVNKKRPTWRRTLFDLMQNMPSIVWVIPCEAEEMTELPLHIPRPGLFQRIISRLFGSA